MSVRGMAAVLGALCAGLVCAEGAVSPSFRLDLRYAASGIDPTVWLTTEAEGLSQAFQVLTRTLAADGDRDGLPDVWETHYGLDPETADAGADTDGDGRSNLEEYNAGTNPAVAEDWGKSIAESVAARVDTGAYPLGFSADTDGDGMPDWWEAAYGLNRLADDTTGDLDGDGIVNLEEYRLGSLPNHDDRLEEVWARSIAFLLDTAGRAPDADRDGLPDWWETANGLDPFTADAGADPDGDGRTNLEEYNAGTNPTVAEDWERSIAETAGPFTTDTRVVVTGGNPSFDTAFAVIAVSGVFVCDTGGLYYDWDGDGIPNWWEARFAEDKVRLVPTEDWDGDGYDNLSEFILYSDPTDKLSAFQLSMRQVTMPTTMALTARQSGAKTALELSWPSAKGRVYRVMTAYDLTEGWQAEPIAVLEGTGERLSILLPQTRPMQFYRVSVDLAPTAKP